MTRRHAVLALFALSCLAQLGTAGFAIAKHERTLAVGERFLFRVEPFDPADPFRGRYLQLGFPAARIPPPEMPYRYDVERVYASIERGQDGFARFGKVASAPPSGQPYLKTRCFWSGPTGARLDLPFARYYVEESIARDAEKALREATGAGGTGAHVAVRVLDGHAVIEELYLGGVPLRERLRGRTDAASR